jgi:heparinase II/III-like protein
VGVTGFDRLVPSEPGVTPSSRFPEGGYVVMRSGWDSEAHQLIVDVGPLGCPISSGHGHADLLSIQCGVSGEPYLVDSGTYVYAAEPAWREHFRSTAAHSTVMVDGESQAVSSGPFRWDARPSARLRRWRPTLDRDFVDASHDAYRRLADPVVHRRRVLFVKPRYWIVVDDLDGAAEHAIDVLFQFAPMNVAVESNLWARARGHGGRGLLVRAFAMAPLKCELREGEESPIRGWVSRDYGRRQPAPVLSYSLVTRLPVRIATLLWPMEDPSGPLPTVTALAGNAPGPVGLSLGATGEIVRFEEPEFVVERR